MKGEIHKSTNIGEESKSPLSTNNKITTQKTKKDIEKHEMQSTNRI